MCRFLLLTTHYTLVFKEIINRTRHPPITEDRFPHSEIPGYNACLAAYRGLSQLATSFVGVQSRGIHVMQWVTFLWWLSTINNQHAHFVRFQLLIVECWLLTVRQRRTCRLSFFICSRVTLKASRTCSHKMWHKNCIFFDHTKLVYKLYDLGRWSKWPQGRLNTVKPFDKLRVVSASQKQKRVLRTPAELEEILPFFRVSIPAAGRKNA